MTVAFSFPAATGEEDGNGDLFGKELAKGEEALDIGTPKFSFGGDSLLDSEKGEVEAFKEPTQGIFDFSGALNSDKVVAFFLVASKLDKAVAFVVLPAKKSLFSEGTGLASKGDEFLPA